MISDKDLNEKLANNEIHARIILEMLGTPKEHIIEEMEKHLTKIEESETYSLVTKFLSEPKNEENNFFSLFAEIELISPKLSDLFNFCFDFMPSSIEILHPSNLSLKLEDSTDVLNDLIAKLHILDGAVKQLSNENQYIKRNLNMMFRNVVISILRTAKLNKLDISKLSGLSIQDLDRVLRVLIAEQKIIKDGDFYTLNHGNKTQN